MDKCKGQTPFKLKDDEDEKGFWNSMSNFAKGAVSMFKIFPKLISAPFGLIKFLITTMKEVLGNPGNILTKLFKIISLVLWQLLSRIIGIFIAGIYLVFNLGMRVVLALGYIVGGFVVYGMGVLSVIYAAVFNPVSI
jgi:hypothetical protein